MGSVLDLGRNLHKGVKHFHTKTHTHLQKNKKRTCFSLKITEVPLPKFDTIGRLIVHVETGSNDHPAEVPESVLPSHNEEWLVKVRMILP